MNVIMRTTITPAVLIVGIVLAGAASAQHQDVDIEVVGGQLVTVGGIYTTGSFVGRVFEGEMIPGSTVNETHEPGFEAAAGTFSEGDKVRYDFVQQLLYWNGTALASTSAGLTVSFGSSSQTIPAADSAGLPGFLVGTADEFGGFHRDLDFSLPTTAEDGLYGIVLKLSPELGTSGFTTSEPFLIAFLNGEVANFNDGIAAMVNVALVPEPSSVVLAGLGAAVLAAGAWRRRRAAGKV